jgi:hypothetical protein
MPDLYLYQAKASGKAWNKLAHLEFVLLAVIL